MTKPFRLLTLSGALVVPAATRCGLPTRPRGYNRLAPLIHQASTTWGSGPAGIPSVRPSAPVRSGPVASSIPLLLTYAYGRVKEVS